MDRTTIAWQGYWPACPTPFTENGVLDLETLGLLIDWYLNAGMHGLFINGTTGEWFSQSIEERKELVEFVVDKVAGIIPVVVGITTFTARESALLGNHAMSVGAAGLCASVPAYSKTLPNETIAYFDQLGKAVQAPLMVYNWPHGTNVEIEGELASALADLDYIVAIKDSTGNAEQFKATTRSVIDRIRVFGNFMTKDNLKFLQEVGGDGTIGGGSIFGHLDPQFWNDYWVGNIDAADAHAHRNEVLINKLWMPGGWRGIYGSYQSQLKLIMNLMGVPGGHVRPPRLSITDESSIQAIRQILIECNIPIVK